MTFTSTGLREDGARCVLDGQLTIKHITRAISLDLGLQPVRRDPGGAMRLTCVGTGALDRSDFDVDFNLVLAVGGILIADRVDIRLEIEAVRNPEA